MASGRTSDFEAIIAKRRTTEGEASRPPYQYMYCSSSFRPNQDTVLFLYIRVVGFVCTLH